MVWTPSTASNAGVIASVRESPTNVPSPSTVLIRTGTVGSARSQIVGLDASTSGKLGEYSGISTVSTNRPSEVQDRTPDAPLTVDASTGSSPEFPSFHTSRRFPSTGTAKSCPSGLIVTSLGTPEF